MMMVMMVIASIGNRIHNLDQKRGKGGGRRKCNNTLIHKPLILNKFTGKTQLNGLTFKKSKLYTVLKDLQYV